MNTQEPLFSITARDCQWSYTKGTGADRDDFCIEWLAEINDA